MIVVHVHFGIFCHFVAYLDVNFWLSPSDITHTYMAYQIYIATSNVYCVFIALEHWYTWRNILIPQNVACLFKLLFYFCKGRWQHYHLQVWNKPRWDLSENDTRISNGFSFFPCRWGTTFPSKHKVLLRKTHRALSLFAVLQAAQK